MSAPHKTCPQCGSTYDMEQRFCPRDGSTLRAPPGSDLVGSVLADRYLIIKRIGEGGMGQVYLAEHVKMKRKSAVKVMHQGMVHDPDAIARFNREAANASQIQHPSVAAIYDFGETADGLVYLSMEFIDGEPLTKIIAREGALPAARAADITRQVADALEAAHDMGIIHRDLKPDNIMIARGRTGEDVAKVVDFGIAKAMQADDQKVTKTGLAIGTPEYMSPEQLGGDQLDSRTDIYSLALVAFNMFTGELPFPAVTSRESLIMRLTEKPRTLAEIKNDVHWPEELQWVMDRALANHPDDRYQHVAQFGRDLVKAVAAMPESALSPQGTVTVVTTPPVARRTELRQHGRSSDDAAPSTSRAPSTVEIAPASEIPNTGRRVLVTFLVLLLAVSLGGGAWWWRAQDRAGPASAAATHRAPADSATLASSAASAPAPDSAHRDSSLAGSATGPTPSPATDSASRSTAVGALAEHGASSAVVRDDSSANAPDDRSSAATAASPDGNDASGDDGTGDPAGADVAQRIREQLAPVRQDLEIGRQRMNEGEYEGALVRFGAAQDKVDALLREHPRLRQLRALRREIELAMQHNRTACLAERDDALQRGRQPPVCP